MATKKRIERGKPGAGVAPVIDRGNTVAGVLLAKVNQETVLEHLGKFGLDTEGSLEDLVLRLAGHQSQAKTKGDCDICGGVCDLELPVCPFCGTGDDGEAPAKPGADASTAPAREPPAAEPPRTEVVPAATTALTRSLDDSVRRITDLKREAVVSYWKLGRAIFENFEARLWSTRKTGEGKTAYHSWNQFVVRELGMSPQHSYALMDVAVNFTEEDVSSVGVSKLALLARVPPAEREALLSRVREHGLPLSQVAEEVRRIAGGKPRAESAAAKAGSPGFRGGESAAAARVARQPPPREDQITVVVQEGRRTLQFVQKANPSSPAVHLNQDPVAEELHLNGTRTTYRLARGANGLVLIVARDRAQGSAFPPMTPKPAKKAPAKPAKKAPAKKAPAKPAKKAPAKKAPAKPAKKAPAKK